MNDASRRRFFSSIVNGILAAIGGVLAIIAGGALASSGLARRKSWLPALGLQELPENEPTAFTFNVARQDGYQNATDRRTIFLVRTMASDVVAFDSTCTHLGCRVAWDARAQVLKCPCHGGVFDRTGSVRDGPPPASLTKVATRVQGNQVLVEI